jgi:hypothetical protein
MAEHDTTFDAQDGDSAFAGAGTNSCACRVINVAGLASTLVAGVGVAISPEGARQNPPIVTFTAESCDQDGWVLWGVRNAFTSRRREAIRLPRPPCF